MLILMRHCERNMSNPFFDSVLIERGINDAESSVLRSLQTQRIDHIFCSPFLRCLQSVKPYTDETNTEVIVDYDLMESITEPFVTQENPVRSLTDDECKIYNVKSIENKGDYNFPENQNDIHMRVKRFIKHINTSENNILICTHERIIKEILRQYQGFHYGYHEMGKLYFSNDSKNINQVMIVLIPYINYITYVIKYIRLKDKVINNVKGTIGKVWHYSTTKLKELSGWS